MKFVRNIVIAISLLFSGNIGAQNCFGDFTWTVNGATVSFTATVSMNINFFYWSFGDSQYGSSQFNTIQHTYAQGGTYTVCLTVMDTTSNCVDSACHTVVIDSCYGSFTYVVNGLTVNFSGNSSMPTSNTQYVWNFGDNVDAYVQNPSHTYTQAGWYTVCFAFYDQSNMCEDSLCQQVYVGSNTGCDANFTVIDSMGYVYFINTSTGVSGSSSYYWDFGDGNYSSLFSPSHVYGSPGSYTVCLTIIDSLTQAMCDTCITIQASSTGLNESFSNFSNIVIAPNPAQESFTVSYELISAGELRLDILDISGRTIQSIKDNNASVGRNRLTINTTDLATGTYIIRLNSNGQTYHQKLMVAQQP
jgi:PKD repeat protein